MLVVAFALAGRVDIDLTASRSASGRTGARSSCGTSGPRSRRSGTRWRAALKPELFERALRSVFDGDETWQALQVPEGSRYAWDPASTYVQEPPFFNDLPAEPPPLRTSPARECWRCWAIR